MQHWKFWFSVVKYHGEAGYGTWAHLSANENQVEADRRFHSIGTIQQSYRNTCVLLGFSGKQESHRMCLREYVSKEQVLRVIIVRDTTQIGGIKTVKIIVIIVKWYHGVNGKIHCRSNTN